MDNPLDHRAHGATGVPKATRIVCDALGLPAEGEEKAQFDAVCATCGHPIMQGETVTRVMSRFAKTSNVNEKMAINSPYVCGHCVATCGNRVLLNLDQALVTPDAAYLMRTDDQRAWALLTPPEPPFVFALGTKKKEHVFWRTPVTLSRDLIQVRVSDHLFVIRRPVLMEALERIDRDLEGRHPYVVLDRALKRMEHGMIRVQRADDDDDEMVPIIEGEALHFFTSLLPGELWALAILAKRNRPTPIQPEPVSV